MLPYQCLNQLECCVDPETMSAFNLPSCPCLTDQSHSTFVTLAPLAQRHSFPMSQRGTLSRLERGEMRYSSRRLLHDSQLDFAYYQLHYLLHLLACAPPLAAECETNATSSDLPLSTSCPVQVAMVILLRCVTYSPFAPRNGPTHSLTVEQFISYAVHHTWRALC